MSDKAFYEWVNKQFKSLLDERWSETFEAHRMTWHASGEYHTKKAVKDVFDIIKQASAPGCPQCGQVITELERFFKVNYE